MSNPSKTSTFNAISKLFLDEIQAICKMASPEQDSLPLTRYLTSGRGLLLLLALSQSAGAKPGGDRQQQCVVQVSSSYNRGADNQLATEHSW